MKAPLFVVWRATASVLAFTAASVVAHAQSDVVHRNYDESAPPPKVYRIGVLTLYACLPPSIASMGSELRKVGDAVLQQCKSAEGVPERLPALASEIIATNPDAVWAPVCGKLLRALAAATRDVPIVVGACTEDMVAAGYVESLAKPGGNITGVQKLVPGLTAKELELLKTMLPGAKRVAVMWNPEYSKDAPDWTNLRAAADKLGLSLFPLEARVAGFTSAQAKDYERIFATATQEQVDAMLVVPDVLVPTPAHSAKLAALAAQFRLPTIYPYHENVEAGGLISYGANIAKTYSASLGYLHKVLHGAKPADLPVQQPTEFELYVNLKTAKTLGIRVPQSILVRADKVIE